MSYFDARFGHIINPGRFSLPKKAHLLALEKNNLLVYRLIDHLLASGQFEQEIPQPYQDFYAAAKERNEICLSEWKRMHWILKQNEIDTVPLNSLWQLERFPDRTQLLEELEVLVNPLVYDRACGVVLSSGYERVDSSNSRFNYFSSFRNEELGLAINLHSKLAYNEYHRIPSDDLWNRRVQWKEGHFELSPLDQVVYSFHLAALNYFDRPARILDLHQVWEWAEHKVQIKDVVDRARAWKCAKTLLLSLEAYSDFGELSYQGLFSPSERKTVRKVWEAIFLNGQRDPLLRWQLSDNLSDVVRGTLDPKRILRILEGSGNN